MRELVKSKISKISSCMHNNWVIIEVRKVQVFGEHKLCSMLTQKMQSIQFEPKVQQNSLIAN